jgi:hypothetical protein
MDAETKNALEALAERIIKRIDQMEARLLEEFRKLTPPSS